MFRISLQLDILCTNVLKHIKMTIYRSRVICIPAYRVDVHGSKKTSHRIVLTSIWSISDSKELCNNNYIDCRDFRDVAAMVLRVHS